MTGAHTNMTFKITMLYYILCEVYFMPCMNLLSDHLFFFISGHLNRHRSSDTVMCLSPGSLLQQVHVNFHTRPHLCLCKMYSYINSQGVKRLHMWINCHHVIVVLGKITSS